MLSIYSEIWSCSQVTPMKCDHFWKTLPCIGSSYSCYRPLFPSNSLGITDSDWPIDPATRLQDSRSKTVLDNKTPSRFLFVLGGWLWKKNEIAMWSSPPSGVFFWHHDFIPWQKISRILGVIAGTQGRFLDEAFMVSWLMLRRWVFEHQWDLVWMGD